MIPLISSEAPAIFHDEIQPCQVSLQGRRGLGHGREGAGRAEVGRGGGCQWHRGPRGGNWDPKTFQGWELMRTDGNWLSVESSILCTFCLSVYPSQSSLFLVASHSYPKLDSVCPKVWRPFLASKRFSGTAVTVTIIGTWSNCHNRINRGIFLDKQWGQRFQCHCSIGLDSGTLCGNIWFNIRFANLQTKWFEPVFSCFFSNSAIWMHLIVFIIVLLFVFMHTHTTHTHTHIYIYTYVCLLMFWKGRDLCMHISISAFVSQIYFKSYLVKSILWAAGLVQGQKQIPASAIKLLLSLSRTIAFWQ